MSEFGDPAFDGRVHARRDDLAAQRAQRAAFERSHANSKVHAHEELERLQTVAHKIAAAALEAGLRPDLDLSLLQVVKKARMWGLFETEAIKRVGSPIAAWTLVAAVPPTDGGTRVEAATGGNPGYALSTVGEIYTFTGGESRNGETFGVYGADADLQKNAQLSFGLERFAASRLR